MKCCKCCGRWHFRSRDCFDVFFLGYRKITTKRWEGWPHSQFEILKHQTTGCPLPKFCPKTKLWLGGFQSRKSLFQKSARSRITFCSYRFFFDTQNHGLCRTKFGTSADTLVSNFLCADFLRRLFLSRITFGMNEHPSTHSPSTQVRTRLNYLQN